MNRTPITMRVLVALSLTPCMLACAHAARSAEALPTYTVCRTAGSIVVDGRLDEPAWHAARDVGPFQFAWHQSGEQEQTSARLLWDDRCLYAGFVCRDQHISAQFTERDQPVYRDDCVELFTAPNPDRGDAYFNFEMNVRAALLDQHHPSGRFSGRDREWNSQGVRVATQVAGTLNDDAGQDSHWTLEVAIPWENFAGVAQRLPPRSGDEWRLNLNRCGGETNPQYSQWSPSATENPDFHRPENFGRIVFSSTTLGCVATCRLATCRRARLFPLLRRF
jgi:hypothetical protein